MNPGEFSCLSDGFRDSAGGGLRSKEIVIFTSDSIVAHRHLNDLLPFFEENDIRPVIFITPDTKSPRAQIPSLKRFDYLEAGILNDVIYPALESGRGGHRLCLTFNEMARRYNFTSRKVENLKDPAIQEALSSPHVVGTISIYQDAIFKPDFIASVKDRGFFWNLHPGLPQHGGLYVIFWSLLRGVTQHGYTLHEINEGIDQGKIIATHEGTIDPGKPVIESYFDFTTSGSNLIRRALSSFLENGQVEMTERNPEQRPDYFTFPTEDDISAAWEQEVRLWGSAQEMCAAYTKIFGKGCNLSAHIMKALGAPDMHEEPSEEFVPVYTRGPMQRLAV